MPVTGALLLTNPRRNRAGSIRSVIARLNRRKKSRKGSAGRRAHGRRTAARLSRRTNGRFVRRNYRIGKGGLKRGLGALAVRMNKRRGRKASRRSSKRSHSKRRRNPFAVVRSNGGFGALALVRRNGVVSSVSGLVSKVPFLGKSVAPFIAPAVVGAVGITAVHFAMQYGLPLVMQYAPVVVTATILPWVAPIGYTVGGAVVGTAILKLPIPFASPATKKAIAVAAVIGGAAVDALRFWSDDGAASPALSGMYGEGLWQTVPFASLSVGGRTYGEADVAAIEADYVDARATDIARCPADLSPREGSAAQMGSSMWRRVFHPVRVTDRSGSDLAFSRHAGREGHRWAWLVRMIGFERFQKLSQMSQWQRQSFIAQLRQKAIQLADQAGSRSELHGLILAQ